jgi:predicted dehydrogenase
MKHMNQTKNIRIGVVGLGLGRLQVPLFASMPGVEVCIAENAGMVKSVPGRGDMSLADFAALYSAKAYTDGIEMINSGGLDCVSLAVSPKYRLPLVKAAVAKGLPILMEKPLAANLQQAEELAKVAQGSSGIFMMEYPLRYLRPLVRLKELLDTQLGRPIAMQGDLMVSYNPPGTHWMWDPSNGNGMINECITHLFDLANFVMGKPTGVFSTGGNYRGNPKDRTLEDAVFAHVQYEGGGSALLLGGGLGTRANNCPLSIRVVTEKGEAEVSGVNWLFDKLVWSCGNEADRHIEEFTPPPRNDLTRFNQAHFIACVREGRQPSCTLQDGLNAQRVMDGVRRSITEKRAVGL